MCIIEHIYIYILKTIFVNYNNNNNITIWQYHCLPGPPLGSGPLGWLGYSMYLVSDIALVVHHCPHPADALLTAPSPQQRVLLSVSVTQEHAQYPRAWSIHVIVEDQTLGERGTPQVRGQQPSFVTRTHEWRLDVHEVTWRRHTADKTMNDTLVSTSQWRLVTAAVQRQRTEYCVNENRACINIQQLHYSDVFSRVIWIDDCLN